MNYKIRWASYDDLEGLGYVHANSWKMAYKDIISDEVLDKITPEKRKKRFEKSVENRKKENAVLIVNKEIVGFITLGECRDEDLDNYVGEIYAIYLLPSYWRKGLGSSLLEWGIEELKNREYQKATLWVLKDNKNSRRFYEAKGFKEEGKRGKIKIGDKHLEKVRYKKTEDKNLKI